MMKIYLLLPMIIESFSPHLKLKKDTKIYNYIENYDHFSEYEYYVSPEMIDILWNISNKTKQNKEKNNN